MHTLVVKVYDPLHPGGSKERGQAPRCGYPPGVRTPKSSRAAGSKLAVLVDGCTRRHYEEGPLDEKCGGRMTQAPLEESEQAPLGVHPKSTSHLPPRCTGGVTGLPSKGAALEPKWLHTPPETLTLSLSLRFYFYLCTYMRIRACQVASVSCQKDRQRMSIDPPSQSHLQCRGCSQAGFQRAASAACFVA